MIEKRYLMEDFFPQRLLGAGRKGLRQFQIVYSPFNLIQHEQQPGLPNRNFRNQEFEGKNQEFFRRFFLRNQ